MLYLGHFSFAGQGAEDGAPVHGSFTCLVETAGIEDSLNKFRTLLTKVRTDSDVLDQVREIYLDEVIEIKKIPEGGFLGHLQLSRGELPDNVNTSLPGIDEDFCGSYVYTPTPGPEEDEYEMEPFMTFQ